MVARTIYRPLRRCFCGAGAGRGEDSTVGRSATCCVPLGGVCSGACIAPGVSVDGTADMLAKGGVTERLGEEENGEVTPGVRLDGSGLRNVCIFFASTVAAAIFTCSGTAMLMVLARAATMEEALGKRAAGSLERLRRMIAVSPGRRDGLMRVGEVGVAYMCCFSVSAGLSPWKGRTPVNSSYRITPRE